MKKILKKLRHYFLPHESNDFKARIFHDASLSILFAIVLASFIGGMAHKIVLTNTNFLAAVYSGVLVDLTNDDRDEFALNKLSTSPLLEEAARLKAEDMAAKGYFAHYGPDGSAPWDWMRKAGYEFVHAGENLAIDFTDSDDVDKAWMKSPTHRANILNSKFSEIGIATARGEYKGRETIYVVQMFGTPLSKSFALPVSTTPVPFDQLAQALPTTQSPSVQGAATEPTPSETTVTPKQIVKPTPKPSPKPIILAKADISTTSTSSTKVATETESFISMENISSTSVVGITDKAEITKDAFPLSFIKEITTNPRQTLELVYAFIGLLIMIGLIGVIGKGLELHHLKHATGGVLLMAVIFTLGYVYKASVFTQSVIVAVNSI
ncbi:MAG: CAP domain-containing protein [bacterium]|nr:CAP domain-containing protein [bacterium]